MPSDLHTTAFPTLTSDQMAGMSEQDQDRFLFMLAARWPDDIRGDSAFDHPLWHYIDYPYKPRGQPASVAALQPASGG